MPSNGADAAGRVIVVASGAYTGLAASAYIEASYRGLAGTGTGRRAKKKKENSPPYGMTGSVCCPGRIRTLTGRSRI